VSGGADPAAGPDNGQEAAPDVGSDAVPGAAPVPEPEAAPGASPTAASRLVPGARLGPAPSPEAAPQALCVSIHDVSPATWDDCACLAQALRSVADVQLTWLVVPQHHRGGGDAGRMEAGLEAALARGDELALHGYTHLDTAPRGYGLKERMLREGYSREGEFAALTSAEAARRIRLGLDWFAERGWPVRGFVPPAWLMGAGAWQALGSFDFDYTTSFGYFHVLPAAGQAGQRAHESPAGESIQAGQSAEAGHADREAQPAQAAPLAQAAPSVPPLWSPSLVYAARNRSGRLASPWLAGALLRMLALRPLIRLSLHPPDLHHPRLLRHAQATLARLLESRTAMTKAAFADRLRRAYQYGPQKPPPRQPRGP